MIDLQAGQWYYVKDRDEYTPLRALCLEFEVFQSPFGEQHIQRRARFQDADGFTFTVTPDRWHLYTFTPVPVNGVTRLTLEGVYPTRVRIEDLNTCVPSPVPRDCITVQFDEDHNHYILAKVPVDEMIRFRDALSMVIDTVLAEREAREPVRETVILKPAVPENMALAVFRERPPRYVAWGSFSSQVDTLTLLNAMGLRVVLHEDLPRQAGLPSNLFDERA